MWYEKYLSIPFVPNTSSFDSCDCAGLVFLVLENELELKVERTRDVDFNAKEKHKLMQMYFNLLDEIPESEANEFDLFFQTSDVWHVGFIVDKNNILQSTLEKGVHLGSRNLLKAKPTKYYRVKI